VKRLVNIVKNEILKIFYKKRMHVITAILLIVIILFAYGEHYTLSKAQERAAVQFEIENEEEWKNILELQLADLERRLDSAYIPDRGKASIRVRVEQIKFYIDYDVNPISSSVARFMGRLIEQSIFLFLPLLIILLAADMVSGEMTFGTIKLILTRPVKRWRIIMGKLLALSMLEMVVISMIALLSYLIASMVFSYSGFNEPVVTGFRVLENQLDTSAVRTIPQWQYLLMVYAIAYFVAFVIGSLSLMVSVMVQSTSASIGIMMSTLIGGSFLSLFISEWEITRYFFTTNLNLTSYLTGDFQIVEGLSMSFSILVLLGWSIGAIIIAFIFFTQKDILS
jgi:ABC-2 type transport system permease protein